MQRRTAVLLALLVVALPVPAATQDDVAFDAGLDLLRRVRVSPNLVYGRANNWEGRLDVYSQIGDQPVPTVIFIHGGGWVRGSKEGSVLQILPYLSMGFSVVNVAYRLGPVSLAPAAVEDCRCALRWVAANAKQHNLDPARIVVAGASAGGHLALTTGMLSASAGFDRTCLDPSEPRVAAIVNFFGIADVADLLDGPSKKPFPETWPYAVQWLGNQPNREDLARRISPLTHVRAGVPPTISIHGDADPLVPYDHSVRLHEALRKAGVANEFVPIPGGRHGGFTRDEWRRAYQAIRAFLARHVPMGARPTSSPER